jgi:pteridine reductase
MRAAGAAALVTGAGRRVGKAIALELARGGCDLAVHYHRSRSDAEALGRQIEQLGRRATTISGDLQDPASWPTIVQTAVDRLGRLDVLVNNASLFPTKAPDDVESFDPALWEAMHRLHVIAPMALCKHARVHLAATGRGKVVNLCDISAERPWPDHLAYCCSKAGLVALTRGLARALAPSIQVNAVSPGIALFPDDYSEERRRELIRRVPLARPGTPEEVAKLVRFLVEEGDYLTGQVFSIDGGRSIV